VDGVRGKALSFDGVDDYVYIPSSESQHLTSGGTITAWVYYTNTPENNDRFVTHGEGNIFWLGVLNQDKLISRIKETEVQKTTKLNIFLKISEAREYCPYCYDGIKNYDETDVDCGGSCKPCSEKEVPAVKGCWWCWLSSVLF